MNVTQYTGTDLLGDKNRDRPNPSVGGTSIQPIIPVCKSGDGHENDAATDPTANDVSFSTLINTVVDTINPLQHIPGVSAAYEGLTGDTQNPVSSMAGGFLFGGPVGLIAGAASSFLEMVTGKTMGQHATDFMASASGTDQNQSSQIAEGLAQIGDGTPMLKKQQGISIEQYQTLAAAAAGPNLGVGANVNSVAWASSSWATQALQQATGAYETAHNAKSILPTNDPRQS